jgi:GTP-binding protein Era
MRRGSDDEKMPSVVIVGRANVGKSTLFNRLSENVKSITLDYRGVTRDIITDIVCWKNRCFELIDTGGVSVQKMQADPIAELARQRTLRAIARANLILFVCDGTVGITQEDQDIARFLRQKGGSVILVINKIDSVKKRNLLPIIDQYQKLYPFREIIPVSARTGEGIDILLDEVVKVLPESHPYYSEDIVTDQTERFWVSEIIREKVIHQSYQEIPYSTAVTIEEFREHPEKNLVVIKATIHVERDSQKRILIGKGGQKLKKIGEDARKEAEAFWGTRVFLELWVNVEDDWTRDPRALNRLGYPLTLNHSV